MFAVHGRRVRAADREGRSASCAFEPTDGLTRGTLMRNTGHGIQMRFGDGTLGEHVGTSSASPLDIAASEVRGIEDRSDIHRDTPPFDELEPKHGNTSRPASRS